MTLQGTKADKTDMHSMTADILGISRDEAKIFNYGRIYGAGRTFATLLLRKFNPLLTPEEADARTRDLYERTKGRRVRTVDTNNVTTTRAKAVAQRGKGSKQPQLTWQGQDGRYVGEKEGLWGGGAGFSQHAAERL